MVRWFGVFAIEVDSSRCYNPSKSRRRRLIVLSSIEESRGQHRRARDNEPLGFLHVGDGCRRAWSPVRVRPTPHPLARSTYEDCI
jgi:hypothetical protein